MICAALMTPAKLLPVTRPRLVTALLLCIALLLATPLLAERRALVIGIDSYDNLTPLKKARNDARAMTAKLQSLGFQVITLEDANRRSFNQELSRFANQVERGDEVIFYFAGHGIEIEGRNYLLPADVPVVEAGNETFLTGESISATRVLQTIQRRGARMTFMILDACRNNPFPRRGDRSVGGAQGLARMDPPEGAFILYSAGTGQTALDRLSNGDPDPNSIFTRALLPLMSESGLSLQQLTNRVRADVRGLARTVNHDQFPAYYDQMVGQFFFAQPGARGAFDLNGSETDISIPSPGVGTGINTTAAADPCAAALQTWSVIKDSGSRAVFESFMSTYDKCAITTGLALERLSQLSGESSLPDTVTAAAPLAPSDAPPPRLPVDAKQLEIELMREADICFDLWYLRNEVFDSYGYCFKTAKGKKYFDNNDCTSSSVTLSKSDAALVSRLKSREKDLGC